MPPRRAHPRTDMAYDLISDESPLNKITGIVVEGKRRVAQKVTKQAEKSTQKNVKEYREMIEKKHKAEINDIYLSLRSSLKMQDANIAKLWNNLSQADKQVSELTEQLCANLRDVWIETQKVKEQCEEAVKGFIGDEEHSVEAFKRGLEGKSTERPTKKTRTADSTLEKSVH